MPAPGQRARARLCGSGRDALAVGQQTAKGELVSLSKYRSVVLARDRSRFAQWVRNLKGECGVYVIRRTAMFGGLGDVLYVGESHSGKLYETLTRHFQKWDHPLQEVFTYDRHRVWVAVQVTSCGDAALEVQDALICSLRPIDNLKTPDCGIVEEDDEVPF